MGALCCRPEVSREELGSLELSTAIDNLGNLQEIDFDGPVDLWHFYLLRSVGKGAFGKVRLGG